VLWYAAGIWQRLQREHRTRAEWDGRAERRDTAPQPRSDTDERRRRRLKFAVREFTLAPQELHSR
jgi:hypothetical protein